MMNGCTLKEIPSFKRLLGLKFTLDLQWSSSIQFIAEEAGKIVSSLHCFRKYLTPPCTLYLYKHQIRPEMEALLPYLD